MQIFRKILIFIICSIIITSSLMGSFYKDSIINVNIDSKNPIKAAVFLSRGNDVYIHRLEKV